MKKFTYYNENLFFCVHLDLLLHVEEEVNFNSYMLKVLMSSQMSRREAELANMKNVLSQNTVNRDHVDSLIKKV
jgi:hypothetical protein